jgi:Phosphotransferase enzyme family
VLRLDEANKTPGNDSGDILEAIGSRELRWLKEFGKPRFQQNPIYRTLYNHEKVQPAVQKNLLWDCLAISRFIIPDDEDLNRPTIRHPDLAPGNIIVSDEGEIAALIDWQSCVILPLFMLSEIPFSFQNYGDEDSDKCRPPKLPDNFDLLSEEDKAAQEELYRRRQLHYFYLMITCHLNPYHYQALRFDPYTYRHRLYETVNSPWQGDNTSLKAHLIQIAVHWFELRSQVAPDCPIHYPEEEIDECRARHEKQKEIDKGIEILRNSVGITIDGWVHYDGYDEGKEIAKSIKAHWIAESETEFERKDVEENFPLQDREEID